MSVFCADLDMDNDMDLAAGNNSSKNFSILKNNGDGTFRPAVNYQIGARPYSIFCADLDGDGDPDVAVANNDSNNVSIFMNLTYCLRGDASGDALINVGDIVYLVNYLYRSGPVPLCFAGGDANSDGLINVGDIVYLVNYLFKNGLPPMR